MLFAFLLASAISKPLNFKPVGSIGISVMPVKARANSEDNSLSLFILSTDEMPRVSSKLRPFTKPRAKRLASSSPERTSTGMTDGSKPSNT